jgi:hypothetical protein
VCVCVCVCVRYQCQCTGGVPSHILTTWAYQCPVLASPVDDMMICPPEWQLAQRFFQVAPELLRSEPLLGQLLLAGILIDTSNLRDTNKTQLLDISIVEQLYTACGHQRDGGFLPPQDECA